MAFNHQWHRFGLLVFAAAVARALITAECDFIPADRAAVSSLGRTYDTRLNKSGTISFDHPGVAVSIGGENVTSVSATLSVKASNNTQANQPHVFGVYIFLGEQYFNASARPPPLKDAFFAANFSTLGWLNDDRVVVPLWSGGTPALHMRAWVVKWTEAAFNLLYFADNYVTLHGFSMCASRAANLKVQRLQDGGRPLPRRIEFLGDSITAGYCNLCGPTPTTFQDESFVNTWGYLLAEYFGAEYHAEAWSGYGMVRNCCGGNYTMPHIFNRTLATTDAFQWSFSSWAPQVLVVNLGSNDHLPSHELNNSVVQEYIETYVGLIGLVTKYYAPHNGLGRLHIVLGCGPIVGIEGYCTYLDLIRSKALELEGHRLEVHLLHFVIPHSARCCNHPDVEGDAMMAKQAIAVIRNMTGWEKA